MCVKLPITYLGIPLGANMKKVSSWQPILDRIQAKLQTWKSSCLSRAGRLVLIKAVLNSLPLYYLSLFSMPKRVAKEIIRMQRRFLWSGDKAGRCFPLVKWELVQQPRSRGGLGVGDLVIKNAALLFKWWWRYASEENAFWRRVIQSIHKEDGAIFPSTALSRGTGTWHNIKKVLLERKNTGQTFLKHMKLSVGKGTKIRFWEDQWAGHFTLKDKFPSLFSLSTQKSAMISSMGWFEGNVWKWTLAWKQELSQQEDELLMQLTELLSGHFPLPNQEDSITWQGKKEYSVKMVQQLMFLDLEVEVDSVVCSVWMKLVPPKVEFFMWLALLGKLNTKERLFQKGIISIDQSLCTFCSACSESLDHVLLQCPFSWKVWCSVTEDLGQKVCIYPTFKQFYTSSLSAQWRSRSQKRLWISILFAIPWRLWMVRNEVIFQQKELSLLEICQSIKWTVAMWTKTWEPQFPYRVEDLARNFNALPELLANRS